MKWFLRRAALLTAAIALAATVIGKADAQVSKALTVAVLTFSNSSGAGGPLMGSSASAAVETQFLGSTRFDVVKKDTVDKTLTDLNLTSPLGRIGIQQLAGALEADDIVTGDVIKVVKDAKSGQWRVTLRVEMTDRSSGELVNGAIATGESGIRPDFVGSDSVLQDEAMNKAAFAAVRSMNERILPEGTVYATSSRDGQSEALLNIGTNSGVRQGMEFIVLRNREQVGRVRITRAAPTDSMAGVIATTRGVQPEDKVRAIFRLENIPVDVGGSGGGGASSYRRSKMNLSGLAMGALALLGLSKLAKGSFSEGLSVRSATVASSGPFNGAPYSNDVPDVPIIHIKWSPPSGVNQNDILGYAVFRLDQPSGTANPVMVVNSGQTSIYDTGRGAEIGVVAPFTGGKVDGVSAGSPTRYLIRSAYNVTTTGTGTGGTTTTTKFAQDVITGAATALFPPPAVSADASDVTTPVTFTYEAVPGGDRYVIQVADNPNFNNADQYPKGPEGIAIPAPPSTGPVSYFGKEEDIDGITFCIPDRTAQDCFTVMPDPRPTDSFLQPIYCPTQTMDINLLTGRIDPTVGQLYWRVGVRNSRDDNRPENGGWVWGAFAPLSRTGGSTLLSRKPVMQRKPTGGPVRSTDPGRKPVLEPTENAGRGSRGR